MAYTTLEDFFGDIVAKSRRGQGISEIDLAQRSGLNAEQIVQIESYEFTPDDRQILTLAVELNLDGRKLVEIARNWMPENPNDTYVDELLCVERLILDAGMEVNCYILKCNATGKGAIIDPGGEAGRILDLVNRMGVQVSHILLTHGHGDHRGALREVSGKLDVQVYASEQDFTLLGDLSNLVNENVTEGWDTTVGNLEIGAVSLPGHTPGGIGYGVGKVFFSGDALFAGSLGGARGAAYRIQIEAVRKKVLSLEERIRVFPGHGPVTSVGEERALNPYFV